MMSQRRILPFLVIASVLGLPLAAVAPAWAQAAAAPATEPAVSPLQQTVEDFWHYAKIASYDRAATEAGKVLTATAEPVEVLQTFETVAAAHHDDVFERLLGWQRVAPLKDSSRKLLELLNKGLLTRREDPKYIESNINRLTVSERGFQLGLERLQQSGEVAVPYMIAYLRNPEKKDYHFAIQRAMKAIGRPVLNPLVAATEMKDPGTLVVVCDTLGDLGYDMAVPYLVRLVKAKDTAGPVRDAALAAVRKLNAGDANVLSPAQLFYDLGERFYYDNAIRSSTPVGFVWYWDDARGLSRKNVPPAIFNEIMAMRSAEYVLKLEPARSDAVSLWLAANYKREAELPEGAADATRAEGQPDAHYYGVSAGTKHLSSALARALRDHNAAVALRVIRSLQEIVGESNFLSGEESRPLLQAMQYPDRLVRFEAAFAVASALPQRPFEGQDRVVPILGEALAQTGKSGALVVVSSQDQLNTLLETLKKIGYNVAGAVTADAALAALPQLPAVDVIIFSEDLDGGQRDRLEGAAQQNPRLQRSARLVITRTEASPYSVQATQNPLITTTTTIEQEPLTAKLDAARTRSGALPMDEKQATAYSLRAADLLAKLAISRGQVLDVAVSRPTLLASIEDARPEIVKAAAAVLSYVNGQDVQAGLLARALDEKTADDLRVVLYKAVASNAKFFGNRLDQTQVESLRKIVEKAEKLDVRSAAAEAYGALSLPPEEVKTLIVDQSRM